MQDRLLRAMVEHKLTSEGIRACGGDLKLMDRWSLQAILWQAGIEPSPSTVASASRALTTLYNRGHIDIWMSPRFVLSADDMPIPIAGAHKRLYALKQTDGSPVVKGESPF